MQQLPWHMQNEHSVHCWALFLQLSSLTAVLGLVRNAVPGEQAPPVHHQTSCRSFEMR